MKNMIKIFVGSIALAFGGTAAAGIASNVVNNQPTVAVAEKSETEHQMTVSTPLFNTAVLNAKGGTSSGLNFTSMILGGIQKGGTKLLGKAGSELAKMAFNALLSQMGVDTRSTEQKALDKIQEEIEGIQNDLKQGVSDIKRTFVRIHNEDIMNNLLEKLAAIQTPVASKMATMISIAQKELDPKADQKELESEKETFLNGLGELNFVKLDGNKLWNQAERLAAGILTPYQSDTSLKLMDLYDEIYGKVETWDYMTVAPRRKFIGYVGSLVNSFAELAMLRANYEMNKLAQDDSNRHDFQVGIQGMIDSVNKLNGELKNELDKLSAIEKKHDEQHLITHRDAVVDKDGNLTYKDGRTVSTKLFAVTTADNDDNYVSYTHDNKNQFVRYDTGYGVSNPIYANYIYTLDCTSDKDLYKAVFDDFNNYKKVVTDGNQNFTMQDYLTKAGFTCDNKDGFNKAVGFYSRIDQTSRKAGNFWTQNDHSDLRAYYYKFGNDKFEETPGEISDAWEYCSGWFSTRKRYSELGDQVNNYYLVFVNQNQKTLNGKIAQTIVEGELHSDTEKGEMYTRHFKGHKKWTGTIGDSVVIA
jgi:hypothetical protein